MKSLLVAIATFLLLQSCAAIMPGRADYVIKPILDEAGKVIAYEATVSNSKDIGMIEVKFTSDGKGGITFGLLEKDVSSSAPAAVAAETTKQAVEALTKALDKL